MVLPTPVRLVLAPALAAIILASCGEERRSVPPVPAWARVAPEQVAAARSLGIPVAFENDLGMRFVLIPPGSYTMGPEPGEVERLGGPEDTLLETPVVPVTIPRPFYMSIHEVTNEQYRTWDADHSSGVFVDDYPHYDRELRRRQLRLDGDRQPVSRVQGRDAIKYATWLSSQDPVRDYRLPTEAEWEYACRAGARTAFWWGDSVEPAHRYARIVLLRRVV